jgi:hypothetical protein
MGGVSNWHNISDSLSIIGAVSPRKILDVGIGFGLWGYLCREFLDIWGGKYDKKSWGVTIHGIEFYKKNRNPVYNFVYDKVFFGDAFDLINNLGKYDLIILGDVLEHFEKERGKKFLEKCIEHTTNSILIHVPLGIEWPQGEIYGNKFERHRGFWFESDFASYPVEELKIYSDYLGRHYALVHIKLGKAGIRFLDKLR